MVEPAVKTEKKVLGKKRKHQETEEEA